MIPNKAIREKRVLCLIWKASSKEKSCKRGFVFQKGLFLVGIGKKTKMLRSISRNKRVKIRIADHEQLCRPRVIDKFKFTKSFLKREMERLMGRKLSPNSKVAQKMNEIAERHVVIELKPVKR